LFQFLGRNSGRSDQQTQPPALFVPGSFNSSVGILVVRTRRQNNEGTSIIRFNSSVGILVVRTRAKTAAALQSDRFQFLGRNSGRSDETARGLRAWMRASFNSSVGILVVRTSHCSFYRGKQISVFQFLGRNSGRSDLQFIGAAVTSVSVFQFLGRNSGRSDTAQATLALLVGKFQFLGRNSGRSDLSTDSRVQVPVRQVSIPRSEFWSFGQKIIIRVCLRRCMFQFLGRNSGRSDQAPCVPSEKW